MLLSKSESIVVSEQIVERTVIWDAMTLMWSHCNANAAKCDFGITNDYVFNERVLMYPLLLARICHWTNNRVAGIWHFMTLKWGHCINNASKRDFSITNDFVPNSSVWIFLLLYNIPHFDIIKAYSISIPSAIERPKQNLGQIIRVSKLNHLWFRLRCLTCPAPSHYPGQCCLIVNCTHRRYSMELWKWFPLKKMHLTISFAICHFVSASLC